MAIEFTRGFSLSKVIPVYTIGQAALGGKIAYITGGGSSGTSGLVAAVSDLAGLPTWGCQGTSISGADGYAIGTGNQNTIDIMAGCATAGIAARLCGDLTEGGYSDWYLPSANELMALYTNRVAIGNFKTSGQTTYWSSTEQSSTHAETVDFEFTPGPWGLNKSAGRSVRAVRSF
jgi:hypothetical protein